MKTIEYAPDYEATMHRAGQLLSTKDNLTSDGHSEYECACGESHAVRLTDLQTGDELIIVSCQECFEQYE